jgi:hypothetical protein
MDNDLISAIDYPGRDQDLAQLLETKKEGLSATSTSSSVDSLSANFQS